MRCAICDAALNEDTISWNHDHKEWDPCPDCLRAIDEVFNTNYDEEEITRILMDEWGDFLSEEIVPDLDFPS